MDGKGRHTDNASMERLWRAPRHEEVFLKAHVNVAEAPREVEAYLRFSNYQGSINPWATGPSP